MSLVSSSATTMDGNLMEMGPAPTFRNCPKAAAVQTIRYGDECANRCMCALVVLTSITFRVRQARVDKGGAKLLASSRPFWTVCRFSPCQIQFIWILSQCASCLGNL